MLQNIVSHMQPRALQEVGIHIATVYSLIEEADPPQALATLRIQLRKPASSTGSGEGEELQQNNQRKLEEGPLLSFHFPKIRGTILGIPII